MTATKPEGVQVAAYILELDSEKKETNAIGFESYEEAADQYLEVERNNLSNPHIQSVLVSADSLHALRTGYPSYYLDAWKFIDLIEELLA